MRDLSTVRQGWEEVERAEAGLLHKMTAQESFRHWLRLQVLFEPQVRATSALFGPARRSALSELQSRLRHLAEWQEGHGQPGSVHSETPAAPAGS